MMSKKSWIIYASKSMRNLRRNCHSGQSCLLNFLVKKTYTFANSLENVVVQERYDYYPRALRSAKLAEPSWKLWLKLLIGRSNSQRIMPMPIGLILKWAEEKLATNKNFFSKATKDKLDKLKEEFEKCKKDESIETESLTKALDDFVSAMKLDDEKKQQRAKKRSK